MAELHVLRVFVGDGSGGVGGNPLGVFLDGAGVAPERRQAVAADLGFSETVFVEDAARGAVRIHTPGGELPFAGHPLVGTSWLLARAGAAVDVLRPPAGEVPTWTQGDLTWIRGRPEWAPPFPLRQLESRAEVDAHPGAQEGELLQVWAWQDEEAGRVRVRVFAPAVGIVEDEATGAAAVLLGAQLNRALTIDQGVGSLIAVRPGPGGTVDIGGRTVLDETRDHPL